MKAAMNVGNQVTKSSSDNLAELFERLFKVGRETNMDQSTIVEAIRAVTQISEVKQITVTGCTFTGDKIVHMDEGESS